MEDKRNKLNTILLIILIVLILLLGAFYIYNTSKNKNDNNKTDNTTTTSKIDNSLNEELKAYTEYDLNKEEERKSIFDTYVYELEKVATNSKRSLINASFEYKDGVFKFIYDDGEKSKNFTIENVREVKFFSLENSSKEIIVIIDNSNILNYIYYDNNYLLDKNIEAIELKKLDKKYVDIKWYGKDGENPCILVDSEGNYYDLITKEKIDKDTYYRSTDFNININKDGSVYLDGVKSSIKLKKGIFNRENNEMKYFISEDYYLYDMELNKKSEKKVKNLYYKETIEEIIIIFEDNTFLKYEYLSI